MLSIATAADSGAQSALSMRVDLRPLQLAREVDVDRLPLGEDVEAGDARLAVAVARVLHAAERQVDLGADRRGVHVEEPRLELAHRREGLVDVLRVDRSRQPVGNGVGDPDALLERRDRHDRRDGAEDLLARDAHLRVGVGEHGRREEPALRERPVRQLFAAAEELRPLLLPDLDVLRERCPAGARTRTAPRRRPSRARCRRVRAFAPATRRPDEVVVDLPVHEQPRRRRAALPRRAEGAPERPRPRGRRRRPPSRGSRSCRPSRGAAA